MRRRFGVLFAICALAFAAFPRSAFAEGFSDREAQIIALYEQLIVLLTSELSLLKAGHADATVASSTSSLADDALDTTNAGSFPLIGATDATSAFAPLCTIVASPRTIAPGQQVVVTWMSNGAQVASVDPLGVVPLNGSMLDTPSHTVVYQGTFTGVRGAATCSASVVVQGTAISATTTSASTSVPQLPHFCSSGAYGYWTFDTCLSGTL